MFGTTELILILVVVVLLFGASRIPALAEAVGKGVRSFKRGIRGDEIDVSPAAPLTKIDPESESSADADKAS